MFSTSNYNIIIDIHCTKTRYIVVPTQRYFRSKNTFNYEIKYLLWAAKEQNIVH